MKPRIISTENANYCLVSSMRALELIVDNCDAFVFETGTCDYWSEEVLDNMNKAVGTLIRKNTVASKPSSIFYVDMPANKIIRNNNVLRRITEQAVEALIIAIPAGVPLANIGQPLSWLLFAPIISLGANIFCGCASWYDKLISYFDIVRLHTPAAFRSAVSAEKIEDFVAPETKKAVNKEKPSILIYSNKNWSIEIYLQHKALRDFVIGVHKILGLDNLFDKKYLTAACELTYDSAKQGWVRAIHTQLDNYYLHKKCIDTQTTITELRKEGF